VDSNSTLEERIALSHFGSAMVASIPRPEYSTVVGRAVTTLPTRAGGAYSATLAGPGLYQFGPTRVVMHLDSNPSLPAPDGNTKGVLTVRNLKTPGTLVMVVSGAPSTLQKGPLRLEYQIIRATGVYASSVGQPGSMELHLTTSVGRGHRAIGRFELVKWNPA
jgi:hypothetical protein